MPPKTSVSENLNNNSVSQVNNNHTISNTDISLCSSKLDEPMLDTEGMNLSDDIDEDLILSNILLSGDSYWIHEPEHLSPDLLDSLLDYF